MPFTNRVRDLRKQNGYTQEELARLASVSRLTINYIENDTTEPTADTMFKIAQALNLRVDDVFMYVEHKQTSAKQQLAQAARTVAAAVAILAVTIGLAYGSLAMSTVFRADRAMAAGNFEDAQMLQFNAESLLHPFITHARYDAMTAAGPLRVGVGRGYLTPAPSISGCQSWLNRYHLVAEQSPYNDVFGWWLHRDLVDCLDRVGATEAAFTEHQAIIAHPSYLLARTAVMDYFDYEQAALDAHLMHDDADARMLLSIARTDHPDLYKKTFKRWPHGDPMNIRLLRPVATALR